VSLDRDTLGLLLATVGRFATERLLPIEAQVCETKQVPPDIVAEMRRLGLFGLSIDERYGGLGLNMEEQVLVTFEISRAAPVFRSVFGNNIGVTSQCIASGGTEEQRKRYLPPLAAGELIGCFCLTEPDAGSDARSLRTTARRDGDSYVLNGTKRYITNAASAGLYVVMARTGQRQEADAISCFLIEKGAPGVSIGPLDRKMGMDGMETCDVIFDDCRVPATTLLGGVEGNGFRTSLSSIDKGRLNIAAMCVGVADRLIGDMVRYGMQRRQFGEPIVNFQLVQAMIADSQAEAYAARTMVLDAARRRDAGERVTQQAACAKLFASEMVGRVADRAVQVHGGAGYMADYAVERLYRDVRLFRIFEGTSQIQQLVIARETIKAAARDSRAREGVGQTFPIASGGKTPHQG
jgi:acyl-CoA dehydrogenase